MAQTAAINSKTPQPPAWSHAVHGEHFRNPWHGSQRKARHAKSAQEGHARPRAKTPSTGLNAPGIDAGVKASVGKESAAPENMAMKISSSWSSLRNADENIEPAVRHQCFTMAFMVDHLRPFLALSTAF
jgi:hypothetical protein